MQFEHTRSLPTHHVSVRMRLYHGGRWHEPGARLWLTDMDLAVHGDRVRRVLSVRSSEVQDRIQEARDALRIPP